MATTAQIRDVLNMLTARAQGVMTAEMLERRTAEQYEDARDALKKAQDLYDQALENAIEVFPQLTTGFNLNPETVAIGLDGKVHVVPAEEAS